MQRYYIRTRESLCQPEQLGVRDRLCEEAIVAPSVQRRIEFEERTSQTAQPRGIERMVRKPLLLERPPQMPARLGVLRKARERGREQERLDCRRERVRVEEGRARQEREGRVDVGDVVLDQGVLGRELGRDGRDQAVRSAQAGRVRLGPVDPI